MSNELDDLLHEFHAQVWHAAQIPQGDTERNERAAEETRDIKRRIRELWNARSGSQGVVTEEVMEFALQCIDGRIGLTENSLFAWSKSDRPEAKERILGIEREAAKQRAMRAALLAAMGGKQSDKLSIAPTGIAFHNSTSAPPPTTISEERAR